MEIQIIFFSGIILASAGCALISQKLYRLLPDKWVCEYGEIPDAKYSADNRCKFGRTETAILFLISAAVLLYSSVRAANTFCPDGITFFMLRMSFISAILVLLSIAAMSDADYMIIPDQICAAAAVSGLLTSEPGGALAGASAAGGLMLFSSLAGRLFSGSETSGMGDIKLLAACGALAGSAESGLILFCVSMLSSALFFSAAIITGRLKYGDFSPLAPWISISTMIVII